MRNFLLSVLLITITSAIAEAFLPWWIIAPVAFLFGCFFIQKPFASFLSGFLAIFLLWTVYAYILSSANENILATKVATLLPLKGSVIGLLLVTGIIGGLVSGFAALSGNIFWKVKEN